MSKNLQRLLHELKSRKVHLESNPAVIYIESVKGCPHSCAMCHYRHSKSKKISEILLKKIEPCYKDIEVMAIHGKGEPLLGDLKYFVEQSIKHDCLLHMNTTGFLLTRRTADFLLETRLSIRFSIHSGKPKTYKLIMGHDLDRVTERISYLVKKAMSSGNSHDFWFSFIVMKENIDEIEDFLELAYDCGIRNVRFMRLLANWQSLKGIYVRDHDFKFKYFEQYNKEIKNKFLEKLSLYQSISNRLGINLEYSSILSQSKGWHPFKEISNTVTTELFGSSVFPLLRIRGGCLAPWIGQLVINQEGNVRLCCAISYSLGNLNDLTLPEIWNSAKMKAIRKSFRKGYTPKACGYCKGINFNDYPNNSFVGVRRKP